MSYPILVSSAVLASLVCVWLLSSSDAAVSHNFAVIPVSRVSPTAAHSVKKIRPLHAYEQSCTSNILSVSVGFVALVSLRLFGHAQKLQARRSRLRHSSGRISCTACRAGPVLTLGTRASPLALAQAYEAKRRLGEAYPELAAEDAIEIKRISTTGDEQLDISLAEIGGKGLFTRELDEALMSKEVDFCVHSTKDVPTQLIEHTELCTMLPREDTRDVLIVRDGTSANIEDLPAGSIIGTASLRRQAQIYAKNPNVKCINFRGNVQTRLRKLEAGVVDATLLAYAGLKRMGMEKHATRVLPWEEMLPAIAQGAISFQCRSDDEKTKQFLYPLTHTPTVQAVTCERAFLATLDGNCKTPIAGQAYLREDGQLHFQGLVSSPDGMSVFRVERIGSPKDAEAMGQDAGLEIRQQAGEEFFQEMQEYVQAVQAANTRPVKS